MTKLKSIRYCTSSVWSLAAQFMFADKVFQLKKFWKMITVILVVIAAFLYYIYFQQRYGYWKRLGVKGPTPIPFAGTFFSEKLRDGQQLEKGFLKKYGEVSTLIFSENSTPVSNQLQNL